MGSKANKIRFVDLPLQIQRASALAHSGSSLRSVVPRMVGINVATTGDIGRVQGGQGTPRTRGLCWAHLHASPSILGAQNCSLQQHVFGAAELNINCGNGSGETLQRVCDHRREKRAPGTTQLDWLRHMESDDSETMWLGYFWLLIRVLLKNMLHSSETPGIGIF